jgi:hypothetical protein
MTAFGTTPNPGGTVDDDGNPLFNGSFQENHTIPREVFSGTSPDYARAREFLGFIDFDGEDAARNSNWAPANERDALTLEFRRNSGDSILISPPHHRALAACAPDARV